MAAGLAGFERVRRHSRHRHWSVPPTASPTIPALDGSRSPLLSHARMFMPQRPRI